MTNSKGTPMKRFLAVTVLSLVLGMGASAQRLPQNVVPESYDLTFTPDLAAAAFSGDETIHVRLQKPASSITLNSAEIAFTETTITAGGTTQTAAVTLDEKNEIAMLTVPNTIPAGPADIHIRYKGILNDQLRGFYLSQTS